MNTRDALLLPSKTMGASGTETIDIKINKPISRLVISLKTTRLTSSMDAPTPSNMVKIELVEGSKPLHSLTGFENQALAYYSRPHGAMEHGQHIVSLSEQDFYALDFGRYLWDDQLAFDPTRFSNPQLKLTYNMALADTAVTAGYLEVWAKCFDEKAISPIGFLSAIEHWTNDLGSGSAYSDIDLPDDKVIRQILVRAYKAAIEPWYELAEARFDENSLAKIPWEYTDLEQYYRQMKTIWKEIHTPFQAGVTTSDRYFYIPQTDYWASLACLPVSTASAMYLDAASIRGGKATLISAADRQQIGSARGYLPWHCFQFPMGQQEKIDDWYNPSGKAPHLRLRAASTVSSAVGAVVLEQLYKY